MTPQQSMRKENGLLAASFFLIVEFDSVGFDLGHSVNLGLLRDALVYQKSRE
jgi:hypothetical protein